MASLDELLHEVRRIEEHRVELTEKRIKSIYRSLMKDLNGFVSEEYVKYADKDGRLFLSYLDSKNKRAKFLEEIVKNVDGISPKVKQEMLDLVDKTYEKSYSGIANAVKNADDTKELLSGTKTLVRPEVLKQAVNNNIEKLTLNSVMEKHRAEIIADIQQTLNVGLMQGDRYETMAKRIQERLGVSYSKASNIARTESHRNIESGMLDGAKETAKIIEKDGGLIYAATWKTMRDQRVRPQQRRKTKNGWKTTISKNGANHQKMEGVTIKVGEQFKLEPDVYAECPGMSGTARNDCRCRCYLSYSLMTVEEFAKATEQTEEAVRKKYNMSVTSSSQSENMENIAENYSFTMLKDENDVRIITGTMSEMAQKYPIKKLGTITSDEKISSYAWANYDEVRVNAKAWNDGLEIYFDKSDIEHDLDFYRRIAKEATYAPTVKNAERQVKKLSEEVKYSRFATYQVGANGVDKATLIRHEYGHVIADQRIGQFNGKLANSAYEEVKGNKLYDLTKDVDSVFRKAKKTGDIYGMSLYASTNSKEFFAEAFVMYDRGEDLPNYIIKMVEDVLGVGEM